MNLPRQPLSRQGPWLIAGFVLVFIILVIAAYGYFKSQPSLTERQKKINASACSADYSKQKQNITVI